VGAVLWGPAPPPAGPPTTTVRAARPAESTRPLLRRRARWVITAVTGAASLVLLTGALALAGVDLPGTAAETAFAKVFGVELPNQADRQAGTRPEELPDTAADTANAVLEVIGERRAGADWTGCEFGAAVSAAARGLEGEPDTSHCVGSGGDAGAMDEVGGGGSAGGRESENAAHAEDGLQRADEASGGAASAGAANAEHGLETADEASAGAGSSDGGGGNAEKGSDTAEQASNGKAGGPGDGDG
jgi:hypothetical protein